MLKREVVNQLKMWKSVAEGNNRKKEVELYKICLDAVNAYEWDEREKITLEVMAMKNPEDKSYFVDLETGERIVIRNGKIEEVRETDKSKYKKAFENLAATMCCQSCPAREICEERHKRAINMTICAEELFEYLLNYEK